MKTIFLDGNSLTIPRIDELARTRMRIRLTPAAKRRIVSARRLIGSWVESDRTVYGVTTGFGEFSNVRIDHLERDRISYNDIRTALERVRNNAVLHCVERKIGSLDF